MQQLAQLSVGIQYGKPCPTLRKKSMLVNLVNAKVTLKATCSKEEKMMEHTKDLIQ